MGTHATAGHTQVAGRTLVQNSSEHEYARIRSNGLSSVQLAVRIIAATLAYYVGARIGFLLQGPLVPQSVLWLPNSILLAVLIVSPPRIWPLFLVPSLIPQLLVGRESNAPLLTIALLFATNCADAMLGATLWRIASRGELRIRSLRSMVTFLVFGATLATLVVSFADAGISVATHWTSDFWLSYATRARSNVLTNVIFVPTALAVFHCQWSDLSRIGRSRWLEGTLIVLGLLATYLAAARAPLGTINIPAFSYLPLAIVVWSAVRFGIGMTGASLLTLTYLTSWTSMRGIDIAIDDRLAVVRALQLALLALAVPTLCLAAVVQERERASQALADSQRALRQSLAKIQALAGGLLGATERERARIALELHDDVGQQLVALGLGLTALKWKLPTDEALRTLVVSLEDQAVHAAEDVRLLSRDLHPAALRFGRLVPAMQELCSQFENRGSMRATFVAQSEEFSVSDDVALCLYRVTQEALSNALRHSGAREAQVTLATVGHDVELHIQDNGVGFDAGATASRTGLGLTSMEERVRLVGGTDRIETSRGRGAHISLRIPNRGAHGAADATPRG